MQAPATGIFIRSGHELLARGALEAGCQFFAAYPAPTTAGACEAMLAAAAQRGVVALTAPDEATAVAYALGASTRGVKAMTATTGSGWTRIADAVEYGVGAELPLVVLVVEQLTPSSGAEARAAQGDRLLLESQAPGLYRVPVFAPSTPAECHELATAAFHWAERLRTPVILRCDRDVLSLSEDVDDSRLVAYPAVERPRQGDGAALSERATAPFADVGGPFPARITAAPHDEQGRLTASVEAELDLARQRRQKIAEHAAEMARVYVDGDTDAEVVLVAFGALARTARDTVPLARLAGRRLAAATVLSLVPAPAEQLRAAVSRARTVIVAEENSSGHYRRLIEHELRGKRVFGITPVGRRMTPQLLLEEVEDAEWKVEYV